MLMLSQFVQRQVVIETFVLAAGQGVGFHPSTHIYEYM
jgi:hypothetical protein